MLGLILQVGQTEALSAVCVTITVDTTETSRVDLMVCWDVTVTEGVFVSVTISLVTMDVEKSVSTVTISVTVAVDVDGAAVTSTVWVAVFMEPGAKSAADFSAARTFSEGPAVLVLVMVTVPSGTVV